jgi:8-oxo-dGTP pyrophosphatase MutT (NUDIX family)
LLAFEYNAFNGIIVDPAQLPGCADTFAKQLAELLDHAKSAQKAVVWLTLPIEYAHYIATATAKGFTYHNCLDTEITLVLKSNPADFAPFVPTHSLGTGGLVQDRKGNILVIREKGATTYKLPGGHLELGEKIEEAVIREVWEETGIGTEFNAVLGMATTHPYRFGKSNIYIVCKLTPLSSQIDIQDTAEIDDARWMSLETFMADDNNSVFNKYLIKSLLNSQGLVKSELDLSQFSNLKHEVFLAG